jgi:hypothetical protein
MVILIPGLKIETLGHPIYLSGKAWSTHLTAALACDLAHEIG